MTGYFEEYNVGKFHTTTNAKSTVKSNDLKRPPNCLKLCYFEHKNDFTTSIYRLAKVTREKNSEILVRELKSSQSLFFEWINDAAKKRLSQYCVSISSVMYRLGRDKWSSNWVFQLGALRRPILFQQKLIVFCPTFSYNYQTVHSWYWQSHGSLRTWTTTMVI